MITDKNKTIVFLGSSVTYGTNDRPGGYSMCEALADKTGLNVVKWAKSGTTLSTARPESYVERMMKEIDSQEKCDCFVVQLSTNDTSDSVELGEVSDGFDVDSFDTKTTFGAIEFIIAKAKEKWDCPLAFYTNTFFQSEKYQKMVDALYVIAKKWNVNIIDLWNNKKMRNVSDCQFKRFMSDKIHPTKEGYDEWWLSEFINAINNL